MSFFFFFSVFLFPFLLHKKVREVGRGGVRGCGTPGPQYCQPCKSFGYTMKEVSNITGNDSAEVEHCRNIITEMLLLRPDHAHMTQMDRYCLLHCWFYFQKCKKAVTCVACGDILRENSALRWLAWLI